MPKKRSLKDWLLSKTVTERIEAINSLTDAEAGLLLFEWELWARDSQKLPPGDWSNWLIKAGRGWGKTRTGAETVRIWKEENPIIHIVGSNAADVRDILVEGPSGILKTSPPNDRPKYESTKRRLTWNNGSIARLYGAEEPDVFRGPECYKAWCDELAKWKYPRTAWDNLNFGLRLGANPQSIITTTPRVIPLVKELIADPNTFITSGTSYENRANLSEKFFTFILKKYEGTRLGRQEINAELLEEVEGALWNHNIIRHLNPSQMPELERVVVAVDPSTTSKRKSKGDDRDSDECGIICAGIHNDVGYVLDDWSILASPKEWADKTIKLYHVRNADLIIYESNQGGDMIPTIIKELDSSVPCEGVHASRGKVARAEPVVSLYEQARVYHVGELGGLEDEMTTWDAKNQPFSPNRIDALVWGLTSLMVQEQKEYFVL